MTADVFANAGAVWYDTSENLSEEHLDKGLALDIRGTVFTVPAALPILSDGGSINLNTRRIRVNAVSPGVIHTKSYEKDMGVDGATAYIKRVIEEIPAGRVGTPEDIGNAVVFLASDEASFRKAGMGQE